MKRTVLWAAMAASLLAALAGAAGLLLVEGASPGQLATMAALLALGLAGATIAKVLIWLAPTSP